MPTANAKLTSTLKARCSRWTRRPIISSASARRSARDSRRSIPWTRRESDGYRSRSTLSDLKDLDYADALTKMNQQLVGLQAAQMSYSKISNLSLFNYLS